MSVHEQTRSCRQPIVIHHRDIPSPHHPRKQVCGIPDRFGDINNPQCLNTTHSSVVSKFQPTLSPEKSRLSGHLHSSYKKAHHKNDVSPHPTMSTTPLILTSGNKPSINSFAPSSLINEGKVYWTFRRNGHNSESRARRWSTSDHPWHADSPINRLR